MTGVPRRRLAGNEQHGALDARRFVAVHSARHEDVALVRTPVRRSHGVQGECRALVATMMGKIAVLHHLEKIGVGLLALDIAEGRYARDQVEVAALLGSGVAPSDVLVGAPRLAGRADGAGGVGDGDEAMELLRPAEAYLPSAALDLLSKLDLPVDGFWPISLPTEPSENTPTTAAEALDELTGLKRFVNCVL